MNTMNRYERDFSAATRKALKRQGIAIIGATWAPGTDGSFANGERVYILNDRGTQRVRSFTQIKVMAS